MSDFNLAPHLERALEAMSKDLAINPQALVNQAVFAWLRINGYVAPSAAAVAASDDAFAPTAERQVVQPTPAPVPPTTGAMAAFQPTKAAEKPKSEPKLEPVESAPAAFLPTKKSEPRLAPVEPAAPAPVAVEPPASSPSGGQLAALARMKAIEADLEKLTRPWPDWVAKEEPEEEEEEEEEQAGEDEEESSSSQAEEEEEASDARDEADEERDEAPSEEVEKPESRDPFEDDLPSEEEPNTGESEDPAPADARDDEPPEDEPPADSTVVLRSVPIVLYLEREGEDPVRVDAERFIIGRGPTCDLVIDSPRVSREHVVLTRSGIRYLLEDLNSSNGTWMGEERISKREIESGDVISLGNEAVTFILRGE